MAAFTGFAGHQQKHIDTPDGGFVGDINLTDGAFHKIGMYWDNNKYEFFIDGYKVWKITNQRFITRSRANALVLSWEVEKGVWGDDPNRTFQSNNREVSVLIDYVRIYRK